MANTRRRVQNTAGIQIAHGRDNHIAAIAYPWDEVNIWIIEAPVFWFRSVSALL